MSAIALYTAVYPGAAPFLDALVRVGAGTGRPRLRSLDQPGRADRGGGRGAAGGSTGRDLRRRRTGVHARPGAPAGAGADRRPLRCGGPRRQRRPPAPGSRRRGTRMAGRRRCRRLRSAPGRRGWTAPGVVARDAGRRGDRIHPAPHQRVRALEHGLPVRRAASLPPDPGRGRPGGLVPDHDGLAAGRTAGLRSDAPDGLSPARRKHGPDPVAVHGGARAGRHGAGPRALPAGAGRPAGGGAAGPRRRRSAKPPPMSRPSTSASSRTRPDSPATCGS